MARRLLVDLKQPFEGRWNGGDAFSSAFLNALSMSFPRGEQYFIDCVRGGLRVLDAGKREEFERSIQGFVAQEATHRRVHALFNERLRELGYDNAWERRIEKRIARLQGLSPISFVGITAAYEHLTALFAEHMLSRPELLANAPEAISVMWGWHCAEESEHKSVAFDLFAALGGTPKQRARWLARATVFFFLDCLRQTLSNLRQDKALLSWSTWRGAARFLLGRQGLLRAIGPEWRAYMKEGYHPDQRAGSGARDWLAANASRYSIVGQTSQASEAQAA